MNIRWLIILNPEIYQIKTFAFILRTPDLYSLLFLFFVFIIMYLNNMESD